MYCLLSEPDPCRSTLTVHEEVDGWLCVGDVLDIEELDVLYVGAGTPIAYLREGKPAVAWFLRHQWADRACMTLRDACGRRLCVPWDDVLGEVVAVRRAGSAVTTRAS